MLSFIYVLAEIACGILQRISRFGSNEGCLGPSMHLL